MLNKWKKLNNKKSWSKSFFTSVQVYWLRVNVKKGAFLACRWTKYIIRFDWQLEVTLLLRNDFPDRWSRCTSARDTFRAWSFFSYYFSDFNPAFFTILTDVERNALALFANRVCVDTKEEKEKLHQASEWRWGGGGGLASPLARLRAQQRARVARCCNNERQPEDSPGDEPRHSGERATSLSVTVSSWTVGFWGRGGGGELIELITN